MSGKHVQPLVPARSVSGAAPSFAGQSSTVALPEIAAGPELVALAIFSALLIIFMVMVACAPASSVAVRNPAAPKPAAASIIDRRVVMSNASLGSLDRTCLRTNHGAGYIDAVCNQQDSSIEVETSAGSRRSSSLALLGHDSGA